MRNFKGKQKKDKKIEEQIKPASSNFAKRLSSPVLKRPVFFNEEKKEDIVKTEIRDRDLKIQNEFRQNSKLLVNGFLAKFKRKISKFKKNLSYQKVLEDIKEENYKKMTKEEKQKMDQNEQIVSKRSSKNKKWINLAFFLVNIGVVCGILFYQLSDQPFVSLSGLDIKGKFIAYLVLIYIFMIMFDVFITAYLIRKDTKKWQVYLGFKTTTVGRYYDAITPMAVGGQPFQIAYLKKYGVSGSASLSIPVAKMIFQQLAAFVLSTIALIVCFADPEIGSAVSIMAVVGFVLTFSVLFFSIFLSMSKKLGKSLVVKILRLLQKMKIIKNYDKQYARVIKYVEEYQTIMKNYIKNPKDFIILFSSSLLRLIFNYSMPFVIFCCFVEPTGLELFFKFFMSGILIDLASGFFPLPGGTGMNELTFSALFANFFDGGRLFWALIFWRLMTYYVYILIGIFVLTYDMSYGNRKLKWKKVERKLIKESNSFKETQIENFRLERERRRKKQFKQG